MAKVKDFMNKPITYGGYLKFVGISTAIGVGIAVAEMVTMKYWLPPVAKWYEKRIEETMKAMCDYDE